MTWIQTISGKKFSLVDPQPEDVCIEDVVAALTHIARFGGHARQFYSVAQHSVHVSDILPEEHRFAGLLHDAPEAYYGDITRPLKGVLREISVEGLLDGLLNRIDRVVALALGFAWPLHPDVHEADGKLLASEARDLMTPPPDPWEKLPPPVSYRIEPWSPDRAARDFWYRYLELKP